MKTAVPLGIYDRNRGQWIPENDGRVIRIANIGPSGATVEPSQVDGTLSSDERLQLATLYPVGKTLWRVQLKHFSVVDLHWPATIALPGSEGTITLGYHPTTGHLETITGPQSVNLTLGYNGRLLTDQTFSDMTTTTTVHHDHDNFFRVTNETVKGLFPAAFHYDDDGLLTHAGAMVLERNPDTGLLDGTSVGNVVKDEYERNTYGEVTRYAAKVNGTVIFEVLTPRDALGRIDSRTEITNLPMNTQTTFVDYVYDAAGRLTDANGSQGSVHYDYDANGNRLGRTDGVGTESGVYDDQDRITNYAGRTYAYNLRGSLESVGNGNATTNYVYDALGGLRQVVLQNGTNIEYEVDGAGRRVWKKIAGNRVQGFVYADRLRPVAELNGSGQIVARFIYGRHVNVPDLMIKNGVTYRIITDHLGSPRFVVNVASGAIAQRMTYDEYGRVLSDSAPGFQPFGFAGGIYDRDTELVRFGARDYDAFTGRWTAKDPILWAGGQGNLYGYVGNDPVNGRDPSGLYFFNRLNPTGIVDPANWVGGTVLMVNLTMSIFTDARTRLDWNGANPVVVLENNPFMRMVENDGLTLGHVVLLASTREGDKDTYEHELKHVTQHTAMGPSYLPAHILAQIYSHITAGNHWKNNPMEWGPYSSPPCAFTTSSPW